MSAAVATGAASVAKARRFRAMHVEARLLVIANAWDAGSARVFEAAGIRAIGTGSAGVAFSHGHPDDERIPRDVMLRAIAEMVDAVDVPVTADILAGMGDSIDAVVETVRSVIALGAAGVNIEDSSDAGGAHLLDARRADREDPCRLRSGRGERRADRRQRAHRSLLAEAGQRRRAAEDEHRAREPLPRRPVPIACSCRARSTGRR